MKRFALMALASGLAIAAATPASAGVIISYSVNGGAITQLATDAGTPGSANFTGNVGNYFFNVGATGFPIRTMPNFLTQSLNIQNANGAAGTLNIFVTQTGLNAYNGGIRSAFTSNELSGSATAARISSSYNAANLAPGQAGYVASPLYSALFTGLGTSAGDALLNSGTTFSETVRYDITFGAGDGTFNGTGNLSAVPEPATWGMMIMGFGLLGGALRRRKTTVAFA